MGVSPRNSRPPGSLAPGVRLAARRMSGACAHLDGPIYPEVLLESIPDGKRSLPHGHVPVARGWAVVTDTGGGKCKSGDELVRSLLGLGRQAADSRRDAGVVEKVHFGTLGRGPHHAPHHYVPLCELLVALGRGRLQREGASGEESQARSADIPPYRGCMQAGDDATGGSPADLGVGSIRWRSL